MPDDTFLKTEETVAELLKELAKLKSATDQIETSRQSAQTIVDAATQAVQRTAEMINTGTKVLNKLEGMQLREQFEAISALLKNLEADQKLIVPNLMDFLKKLHEVEKSVGDQGSKITSILAVQSQSEQRNKLWMGIAVAIIALQIVTIIVSAVK